MLKQVSKTSLTKKKCQNKAKCFTNIIGLTVYWPTSPEHGTCAGV